MYYRTNTRITRQKRHPADTCKHRNKKNICSFPESKGNARKQKASRATPLIDIDLVVSDRQAALVARPA